jgi:filamentous hemagglutinin family protein
MKGNNKMNQFKRKITAYTALLAFLSLSSAATYAATGAIDTSPANQTHTSGIEFVNTTNRTDVNNIGGNGATEQIDWVNFVLPSGKHVNYGFNGNGATTINRVIGGQVSEIRGAMTTSCIAGTECSAYGTTNKVIFINPAGVLFGQGSQIDVNSFTVSTFDMKNAKNLKGLSAADLAKYRTDVLDKASAEKNVVIIDGKQYKQGQVTFDSNYVQAFKDAGIKNPEEMIKNSKIELNGATFNHWENSKGQFDFNKEAALNTNKSLALVSNNIEYKDSLIKIGTNFNYRGNESYSNVKLVTADGVTFDYLVNGYIDGEEGKKQ